MIFSSHKNTNGLSRSLCPLQDVALQPAPRNILSSSASSFHPRLLPDKYEHPSRPALHTSLLIPCCSHPPSTESQNNCQLKKHFYSQNVRTAFPITCHTAPKMNNSTGTLNMYKTKALFHTLKSDQLSPKLFSISLLTHPQKTI